MFEEYLRALGLDPEKVTGKTREIMQAAFEREKKLKENPPAPEDKRGQAPNAEQAQARVDAILGVGRAVAASASTELKGEILAFAAELVGKPETGADEAARKIADRAADLASKGGEGTPVPAHQNRGAEYALAANPDAVLSRKDCLDIFSEPREDRNLVKRAAESVLASVGTGNGFSGGEFLRDLSQENRTGLLVVHDEGSRTRRTITASSANVAVQAVLNILLNKAYQETPDITDPLVSVIPGGADEITFPEVEADEGVKKLKEGDPYPLLGTTERDVKSSFVKYGAAVAQTRENNVFDRLGRVTVALRSLVRQLKRYRAEFRLARICDSTAFDGRYVARPGNDNGSSAFYSTTADYRGNYNLIESAALADETDIDAVVQVLHGMQLKDGSHVMADMRQILVPTALHATAWKIVNAIYAPSAVAATGQPLTPNPYGPGGMLESVPRVVSHPAVATYAGASTTWYAGDFAAQFYEIEHWPLEMVPVITSGEMALRDIVNAWKGSFCIDLIALSNMFTVKCTA